MRCFESGGYDQTTTASIARRARVGMSSLYAYFPDKRAILLELLDETMQRIAEHVVVQLDPELWRGKDLRKNLRALIDAVFHARTISPGIQRILWQRFFDDPEFQAIALEIESRVRLALERLFDALRDEGRLRDLDVRTTAFVVHASVDWIATRLYFGETGVEVDDAAAVTTEMIARFLFEEDAEPQTASDDTP